MTKYLTIKNGLYLTQTEVKLQKQEETVACTTNHIWIYDRSGSMYYIINRLVEDLIVRAKQIPEGDTITIGWFSSENKFNFILKGFKISSTSDYEILEKAIRKNNYIIGLTCFSEILDATESIIEDLSIFTNRFALCFFSDGYPVTGNYKKEKENIFKAINKIEGKIAASLLVGYGNYYNKELMSKMAEALGGALTHSSNLSTFNISLENFVQNVQDADNKISVKIDWADPNDTFFGISSSGVNLYALSEDSNVNYTMSKQRGKNNLYVLTTKEPQKDWKQLKFTAASIKNGKQEAMVKAAYAAAYVMIQKTRTDTALEILSVLGDKYLIDIANNAFTNEEYGHTEHMLSYAITSPKKRFISGRDTNYLPRENAFCVLDVVDLLMGDEDAYFYPTEPTFNYERIGVPSVTKDGYPTFTSEKNVKCPFSNISWSETKLNLSVLLKIPGSIKLKKTYKKCGFTSNTYLTWKWRNYALVKDGFINVTSIPMSMSYESFRILMSEGLIDEYNKVWSNIAVFSVHLDRVPVMNRSTANGKTSAKDLFEKTYKAFKIKAYIKSLKYLRNQNEPKHGISAELLKVTEEQAEFLSNHGITNNGFNPPKEELKSIDYYMAKEFIVKMAKLSSLPKVSDVVTKVEAGKKLTPREELIREGLLQAGVNYESEIKSLQKDLSIITSDIQRMKFAIILGKKWFDEFDSRKDNTMELCGITYSITLKDTRIDV